MAPPRTRTVPTGFAQPSSKRARRLVTTSSLLDLPQGEYYQGINRLSKYVFDEVINRLKNAKVVVHGVDCDALSWMLPNEDAEPRVWEYFLEYPWLVTDDVLQSMFDLQESTVATPDPPTGTTLLYVRSLEISGADLLQVCTMLEQADVRVASRKITRWREAVALLKSPFQTMFIRYVGMTASVSGYSRFAADQRRTTGFYGGFMSALEEIAPKSIERCRVYTFPHAATKALQQEDGTVWDLHITHTDIREQALIELFDRTTSLNQRVGGIYNSYQPNDEDLALFENLHTKAFDKIERMIQAGNYNTPTDQAEDHVAKYIRSVLELGQRYPEELGTDAIPASDEMAEAWEEQATYSSCYDGTVLFLLVGDYCPRQAMLDPAPYWNQLKARSVHLMKDTLSRLQATEKQKMTWDHSEINEIVDASLLPFVDFQYTPTRKTRHPESAATLREYMEGMKPLIVMTFEHRTTGVVGDNFVGTYSDRSLGPIAGIPRIRYWTDPGNVRGRGNTSKTAEFDPDPNDCFIQIPSYHPGSQRYLDADDLRRVFEMTQWQLILAFDVALGLLEQGWQGTRKELCDTIMAQMQFRWDASGCANALEAAKKRLETGHFAEMKGRYSSDPNRAHRSTLDGQEVAVNLTGIVSMYWTLPDKSKVKVLLGGGSKSDVHPPKGATGRDKIRTIHFLPTGIDVRDADGKSATYTRSSHKHTNPTFPGAVLRGKIEASVAGSAKLKALWESETGLDFDETFPPGVMKPIGFNDPSVTKKHHKSPCRIRVKEEKKRAREEKRKARRDKTMATEGGKAPRARRA